MILAALFLALVPQGNELDERVAEILSSELGTETLERPPILLRTPDELPRSEEGAWDAFADVEARERLMRELDESLIASVAKAEESYLRSRFPTTLAILYPVLEAQPDLPPALMLLGTTYFRLRRYDDCRVALERFLEVSPVDLWRTQALGHAYYSLGDYPRALAHYERVLSDSPDAVGESPEALRGLALCHMRLGDSERALALLDRVIELRPNHAEAYTFMARILYDEDRLEEALAAADKAREIEPFQPQAWYFAMRIQFDLGREDEAMQTEQRWRELDTVAQERRALEMQLRFRPGHFGLIMRLCELAAQIGDVETVRGRLADLVVSRPPEVSEAQVRILVLDTLSRLGDADGARVAALALEETCPDSYDAWKRLELYYASIRDRVNQIRCTSELARFEKRDG